MILSPQCHVYASDEENIEESQILSPASIEISSVEDIDYYDHFLTSSLSLSYCPDLYSNLPNFLAVSNWEPAFRCSVDTEHLIHILSALNCNDTSLPLLDASLFGNLDSFFIYFYQFQDFLKIETKHLVVILSHLIRLSLSFSSLRNFKLPSAFTLFSFCSSELLLRRREFSTQNFCPFCAHETNFLREFFPKISSLPLISHPFAFTAFVSDQPSNVRFYLSLAALLCLMDVSSLEKFIAPFSSMTSFFDDVETRLLLLNICILLDFVVVCSQFCSTHVESCRRLLKIWKTFRDRILRSSTSCKSGLNEKILQVCNGTYNILQSSAFAHVFST
ncbi:hypothetical protein RCL1_000758 [Eukaryota sp. TZLM3-RCL]